LLSTDHFDIVIAGAGVIGLAIAYKLTSHYKFQKRSILLLEQHQSFGQETSSRNSEVIHAGIYYPEASLKAQFCVEGKKQLYHFCEKHDVLHKKIGKLIVASNAQQAALDSLANQASRNGVDDLEEVSLSQLKQLEPDIRATLALFSPSSGIIDSHGFMSALLYESQKSGLLFSPLTHIQLIEPHVNGFQVLTDCQDTEYSFTCSNFINATGLSAQSLANRISGYPKALIPEQKLVKGNYFSLQGKSPFNHLVYPLPEENLKGLGVHVTLDISGQAKFGPDTENIDFVDYSVDASREIHFRSAISQYYPDIAQRKLLPAYSGIRPKLFSDNGAVDFVINQASESGYRGLIQLFGIESPGLTASLAIADYVTALLE
jgi:L-2-hydroxyglutarate oxidase LhgO